MRYQATGAESPAFVKKTVLAALGAAAAVALATPAHASGTPAGTSIVNTATATYDLPGGGTGTVTSNTVTLKVDELIDVTVAWKDPGDVTGPAGGTNQVLSFNVTNGGNASGQFTLGSIAALGGDDFDPAVSAIILDTNGNGVYDPGVDTVYVPGVNDPTIAADGTVTAFILSTLPVSASDGNRGRAQLTAASKKGTGTPGTSFPGVGTGGVAAVVGLTGGKGAADGWYKVQKAAVTFVKSATVADPFGGTTQVPGALVTYTLSANVTGTGSLANLKVSDPIPGGTTYQAGSLALDGTSMTDAADADAGSFGSGAIAVNLGTVAAGTTKTITFKVKIN